MKRIPVGVAFAVAALLCRAPNAIGSVGGQVSGLNNSSGTLYANLSRDSVNFELGVSSNFGCGLFLNWTDDDGNTESLSVPTRDSTSASSSLPAGGAISWTLGVSGCRGPDFNWQLERAPAQSVNGGAVPPQGLVCGSSGTLYTNLISSSVTLDLGLNNGNSQSSCSVTVSWTDASGHAQTVDLGVGISQGVSTSLPAGGIISWSSTATSPPGSSLFFSWQLERVVRPKLW